MVDLYWRMSFSRKILLKRNSQQFLRNGGSSSKCWWAQFATARGNESLFIPRANSITAKKITYKRNIYRHYSAVEPKQTNRNIQIFGLKNVQLLQIHTRHKSVWGSQDLSIPSSYTSRSNHFKHYKKCHVSSRWKEDISSFVKSQYQSWITFYLQWVLRTTGWVWWHFIQSVNALESHTTHNPAAAIGFSKLHLLKFFHYPAPEPTFNLF